MIDVIVKEDLKRLLAGIVSAVSWSWDWFVGDGHNHIGYVLSIIITVSSIFYILQGIAIRAKQLKEKEDKDLK